jgi:hypothetical protein
MEISVSLLIKHVVERKKAITVIIIFISILYYLFLFLNILVAKINELRVKKIKLKEEKNNINVKIDPKNFPLCNSVKILVNETPLP